MGIMSASDAAPLPRLGEVFFDVRGNSRSMRLSWYADTGVAVLSIWQGGMCTGTFRLAIGDLPRLVETLQRGPGGRQAGWDSEASAQALADPLVGSTAQVQPMEPLPGQGQPDLGAEPVDYLAGAREYPDHRAGPPEYLAEPPDHRAVPPEYRTEPPDDLRTGPAQYRSGSADYLAGPPDQTGTREYLAPPDRRAGPPDRQAGPPDYQAGPLDYQAGPPEYQAGPPEYQAGLPDYQAGPPDYEAGRAEYQAVPPRPRTGYLADLPPAAGGADPAGYDSALYVGSRRPDASDPDTSGTAAYPHDTGGQVRYQREPADDLYRGTGPLDYHGEPSMPHYLPGSSASTRSDALNPSTGDYPANYGAAVTDDIGHEPRQDSFPYGGPRGSHGTPGRRVGPDAPSG
jgi:hypothetical protein